MDPVVNWNQFLDCSLARQQISAGTCKGHWQSWYILCWAVPLKDRQ